MRITQKDLEQAVRVLNLAAGANVDPYTKQDDGKYRANPGTYLLDGAYGGWKLVQVRGESGGERSVTSGYVPKSQLYHLIHAYIDGLRTGRGDTEPRI